MDSLEFDSGNLIYAQENTKFRFATKAVKVYASFKASEKTRIKDPVYDDSVKDFKSETSKSIMSHTSNWAQENTVP